MNTKYQIIYENDFKNEGYIKSLYSYGKTGFLMMEFDNFCKWYSTIDLCDPMIGSYEKIIEFNCNEKEILKFDFELKAKSKFKVYIKIIYLIIL